MVMVGAFLAGWAIPAPPQQAATKVATASNAQSASANTAPASAPDLSGPCKQTAADLKDKLDSSFAVLVQPPFVVAGDMNARDLRYYLDESVLRPAQALWNGYFRKRPDKVITVLLFTGDKTYRASAKKLFGDTDVSHYGYYRPGDRTLVMNISTGGGTLIHELTHALIEYDFPDHPDWFNEGFASLHEQCRIGADEIVGLENWRLPGLLETIGKGKLQSLPKLVSREDFYGAEQGTNYAQARYFCLYMQRQGLLKKFYAQLRDTYDKPEDSVKAIEKVFAKKIDQVDKEYVAWVKTLKFPP